MKIDDLLDAIGDARDEYIYDVRCVPQQYQKKRRSLFRKPAALTAAFMLVLLLAAPVSAEIKNGYVSNLLAPLYGGAQTEIVDRIGRPISASVAVGDYTLTADALIGDRYNIAIIYSLTRTDGGQIENELSFDEYRNTAKRGTWGGTHRFHLSEDKRILYIVEEWTAAKRLLLNRRATATFTNLIAYDEDTQEKILLEKGTWELRFTIRYEDQSVKIPIDDTIVEDAAGKEYTVHKIIVSPIGVHLDLTGPSRTKFFSVDESPLLDFTISLILYDGSEINIDNCNLASRGKAGEDTHKVDFGAMFDEPIPLDQMKELVICGTPFVLWN